MPDVGALLAVIAAAVSIVAAAVGVAVDRHRRKRDFERTASLDASSVAALESQASLDFLLRERLGEVNVSSYFRDPRIRREVETALDELATPSVIDPNSLPTPEERTISFSNTRRWLLSGAREDPTSAHRSLDEALAAARASLANAEGGKIEVHEPDGRVVIDRTRPRGSRFMLYTDKAGGHRFMLRDASGRPLLVSEGHSSRAAALNAIESVRRNADSEIVEIP